MKRSRGSANAALFDAVARGDEGEVRNLVESGVSVDGKDRDGRTALHYAVLNGRMEMAKLLLELGPSADSADRNRWTPLHFAAQDYRPEVVKLLLSAGATVDVADTDGNTPLWRAVFDSRGRRDVIKLLMDAGADKTRKNLHGVSPEDLSRTIANFKIPLVPVTLRRFCPEYAINEFRASRFWQEHTSSNRDASRRRCSCVGYLGIPEYRRGSKRQLRVDESFCRARRNQARDPQVRFCCRSVQSAQESHFAGSQLRH